VADGLDREESRRRYKLLIGEIFRRAETPHRSAPTAVALALEAMGWLGQGRNRYSDRAMTAWRNLESFPSPEQLMALVAHYDIDANEFVRGEAPPPSVADRLERRLAEIDRRQGEQEGWMHELAAHLGVELGSGQAADDSIPRLDVARLRREVDELRAQVDDLRRKEA
jgi:hypothetical protein